MKEPLISIIVPIYNVEEYIHRCVDSIINQTYYNLEIILVNDGSPDNCPKICDDYAKNDKRVKVIHKSNGGLSDARNVGVEAANGEYIAFVDSDDWIEADMYEILIKSALLHGADIVECGVNLIYNDRIEFINNDLKENILTNYEALDGFLTEKLKIMAPVWNKLYHRNLCSKTRFPIGRLHEDGFFTYKVMYFCQKYVQINRGKYNYVQERPGSIMTATVKPKNIVDVVAAFEERNAFFKMYNEEDLYEKSKAHYYRTLLTNYIFTLNNLPEETVLIDDLKNKLINCKMDILENKYLGIKKIKFVIFFKFPKILLFAYKQKI